MSTPKYPLCLPCLPSEIFHLISLAVPLNTVASTLLSLCLVNREINSKTQHLLFHCLVLRNDEAASMAFQIIENSPETGKTVKEVHIFSEQSPRMPVGDAECLEYLGGLKNVVARGLFPNLVSIGIVNESRFLSDRVGEECYLPPTFWAALGSMAPQLRFVTVRNLAGNMFSEWLDEDVIDKTAVRKDLLSYNISVGLHSRKVDHTPTNHRLLQNVEIMQSHLRSLTLHPVWRNDEVDFAPLALLVIPHLSCLELGYFHSFDVSSTSRFWLCHKRLERVTLWECTGSWFEHQTVHGLLLQLTHFKASFECIRALLPLLPQLRSLCVFHSYNMQVPYLMCSLLHTPLPQLLSLEIQQYISDEPEHLHRDGARWHRAPEQNTDTEDATAEDYEKSGNDYDYMYWISQRCPNIEEIGFLGDPFFEEDIVENIGTCFAQLLRLKHVYYPLSDYVEHPELRMLALTRELANLCPELKSHGRLRQAKAPLLTWVSRGMSGEVEDVLIRDRWGMEISVHSDDPFPDTRPYMMVSKWQRE